MYVSEVVCELHVYTYEGCQIHSSNSLGEKENQPQLRLEPQDLHTLATIEFQIKHSSH